MTVDDSKMLRRNPWSSP